MAELISNPDDLNQVFNVEDDVKASAEYENDRMEMLTESSLETLDDTTNGFEGFFDSEELDDTGFIFRKARHLTTDIRNQVDSVLAHSANSFQSKAESDNSSVSKIEANLWKYRKNSVRSSIMSGNIGAAESLLVAKGNQEFLKEAKTKVLGELTNRKSDYSELMNKKLHFWNRIQNNRKHRIEKFEPKIKDSIDKLFTELENNAGKMTTANKETKIGSMGKSIERKIKSAGPDKKANMLEEIMNAVNHTGALASLILPEFNITNPQEKINFLEAIRTAKWIREKITDRSTSESKFKLQKSVVESAQAQEEEINKNIFFKDLEKIKENDKFKNLPEWTGEVTLSVLVESIEKDLHRNWTGGDPNSWFDGMGNHEHLGNAMKMKIFLDNLAPLDWSLAENLREETRQMLVKWVENQKGDFEYKTYSNKAVLEQLDILQGLEGKGLSTPDYDITGLSLTKADDSVLGEIGKSLKQAKDLDITVDNTKSNSIEKLESEFGLIESDVQTKYHAFKDTETELPPEDWKRLNDVWEKVMEARSFIINQIEEWKKTKEAYDEYEKERDISSTSTSKLKKIQDAIVLLQKGESDAGSIAEADKEAITAAGLVKAKAPSMSSPPIGGTVNITPILEGQDLMNQWKEVAKQRKDELTNLKTTENEILSKEKPSFDGLEHIQKQLDSLNLQTGLDHAKRIDKSIAPGGQYRPLHERVHDNLKIEFENEMENTFLKQWEQNDQFDILKKQDRGGKVKINFQEVGTLSHFSFPNQLNDIKNGEFKIRRKTDKGVELVGKVNGADKIIRITKASVDFSGKKPKVMKNASLYETTGTGGAAKTSETFCLVTNMQIS